MKIRLKMTAKDIAHSRAKFIAEHPELAKKLKPTRITGNTRNAALREMLIPRLGTKIKVTNATMPKPVQPGTSAIGKEDRS